MKLGHFLGFIVTFDLVAGKAPTYALLGQKVSFYPQTNISPQEIKIIWKHNGDKVVEFNGQEEHVYGSYTDRVTLDWHSGDLDIFGLQFEDTGEYELEIYRSKILHRSQFKLEVIDQVPVPTVSCEITDDSSALQATLTCSAQTTKFHALTGVEWDSHGSSVPGLNLTISLGYEHDDDVYSCTVKNALTNQSAMFTAKECYDNTALSVLPAVICSVIVIVIVVALVVAVLILRRRACFARENKDDVEKLPPLQNPNGSEKKKKWRNWFHNKSTLPSTQPLACLSQLNEQRSECESSVHEEVNSKQNTWTGTKNIDNDHEECKLLLSNRETLPSTQRLGHVAQFSDDHSSEERDTTEETEDLKSTQENNVCPDVAMPNSPSTQDSVTKTPSEGDIVDAEHALSKTDCLDAGNGKNGESDSGLDEGKELEILNDGKELPGLSMSNKEIRGQEPNDCSASVVPLQEKDKELSEEELYNESLSTADPDDTGIIQTLNTNNNDFIEPTYDAHTATEYEEVDTPGSACMSESSTEGAEAAEDEDIIPEDENDVMLTAAEETGSKSDSEEELETKETGLERESAHPDPKSDSTTAQERTTHLTEEESPQQDEEKLAHEGRNDEESQNESKATRKRLSSDTSQQAESPTLSKQEDIDFVLESLDVQTHQESRHNSLSESSADEGPNKKEAFIDEKERQCGPEEQRPAEESLCENKEVEKQTEAVE